MGIRGHTWAACLSVAMAAAVILSLTYAGLFGLVWLFSLVVGMFGRRERSPFKPDAATPCSLALTRTGLRPRFSGVAVGVFGCARMTCSIPMYSAHSVWLAKYRLRSALVSYPVSVPFVPLGPPAAVR